MRLAFLTLPIIALTAAAPSVLACDGKAAVEAAFKQQQKQPWRTEIVTKSQNGDAQQQSFDFQPPDRMHRKATAGGETIETIGIGKWAWSNLGGGSGWEELQPMHAKVVTLQIQEQFAPPRVTADFNCLGDKTLDGKTYQAYQTTPETVEGGLTLARTIYIDPETGLPAYNVVGAPDGSGDPVVRGVFTYPSNINILSPLPH